MYIVTLASGDQGAGVIHYGDDRHTRPGMAGWNRINADEVEIDRAGGEQLDGETGRNGPAERRGEKRKSIGWGQKPHRLRCACHVVREQLKDGPG
jgi:hypothetical protein